MSLEIKNSGGLTDMPSMSGGASRTDVRESENHDLGSLCSSGPIVASGGPSPDLGIREDFLEEVKSELRY
jgi:hypothetical protein